MGVVYDSLDSRLNVQVDSSAPNEKDLVAYLRYFAQRHSDDLFPPTLNPMELVAYEMKLRKEGKSRDIEMTKDERLQQTFNMTRGGMFVLQMKPENDWHYAGEGVCLGDADTPICWYKPDGSETYRVIYGDLSVQDVVAEDFISP